jgi:hypothetical protein
MEAFELKATLHPQKWVEQFERATSATLSQRVGIK